MSYQVLARKWRPQNFDEVVGQNHIVTTLKNSIASGRISHSFLFAGSRGVGKTSMARILAKALNCQGGLTINPCNECAACIEITASSFVDVIEIDGASNNSVDDVREIRDNVKYLPLKARYKIYIIDEVHMLSTSAFNALLKTLEEPPPHVVFIFATTEPHKLPDTILSRCQRYDFRRIPIKQTVDFLKRITQNENIEISDYSLNLIAKESFGGLRDALSLLDQLASFTDKKVDDGKVREILGVVESEVLFDIIDALLGKAPVKCVEIVERIYASGFDIKKLSQEILEQLRNLLIFKFSENPSETVELPEGYFQSLEKISEKVGEDELWLIFDQFSWEIDSILRSTNPRFNLELVLMKLARLKGLIPIEKLLDRLESIEKNISFISAASEESTLSHKKRKNVFELGLENKESASNTTKEPPEKYIPAHEEWWGKLKESLLNNFSNKPLLPTMLEKVAERSIENDVLTLKIEDGLNDIILDFFKEDEVKKLICDFFGRQITLNIIIFKANDKNNGRNNKQIKEKALNHPLVKEALSAGCQIVGVKPLGRKENA